MTVLVLGASGTTGSRLVRQLLEHDISVRRAGRSPSAPSVHGRGAGAVADVRFDWTDPATFAPAVRDVHAVYVVAPPGVADPEPIMIPFLVEAQRAGVQRVALLSSSAIPVGGIGARLADFVPGWTILRPTWFASNFTGDHLHARSARADGEIVSATEDGRVPFIDPDDIAAVARHVLAGPEAPCGDLVLTGPEPLTFDDVAAQLSAHTGRTVRHRRISVTDLSARLRGDGIPGAFADLLAGMDAAIAQGAEDRTTSVVEEITGRPARSFRSFLSR
ncbi:NAD(P)H-binding protein [Winogradskya consettensis]|uniref:Oxidoreductase n=1 Tax=Winogradskya consettensis TaxID=113560 RepID=A0A919T0P1_9ACTN|nr:NAD(P)H-binding protein [Actinoplanes consettensis]GIM82013.1 oxidoreductase [Actinoplanes consettensis]